MPNVTDIDTRKTRIARLLQDATDVSAVPAKSSLYKILGISLLGTMLPLQAATVLFSITSILICIALLMRNTKTSAKLNRPMISLAAGLVLISSLSGRGPALYTEELPDLFGIERQTDIKTHTITRFGIFGLGLSNATPEQAQLKGDIEDLVAVKIDRGYGLISMARISVAGK